MVTTQTTPDLSGRPVLLSFSLGTACFALSTTFVRFCVRTGINNRIGPDDWTSVLATVVALIGTVFSILESTTADASKSLQFDVLGQPWYMMSATLSKIAICLLFIRLLGRPFRQWRILLSILIFLMAAVNLTFSMTVNLQCRPLEKLWNPAVAGSCWDPGVQLNFGYFQGAFSVFSWFFLALFPIMIVRNLEVDGNGRWPFYVTCTLSFTCGVMAIVRTAETSQVGGMISVYTFHTFCASLMAILEQNFGLIAANVLTLGPLFSPASSRASRTKGKTPSRTGSTRTITRVSSSGSNRSSSFIDLKRTTNLIIEGPRRQSLEGDEIEEAYDHYDLEAWPRGIIKTVSVEVIEEVNPDHVPTDNKNRGVTPIPPPPPAVRLGSKRGRPAVVVVDEAARESGASGVEQDWEAMLRAGPPAH
ncbi:hypothetical protein QBC46DRAFT_310871 [Diplogelasinospora grovesii]|uniref:Rhodopsin domain-containing protein n=1 Tax=Diplogelasinospora grovesii TaxID=303347 RepID=A0AAN6N9Q1_9PEZI|nr:hypothetical protein QBC46DRAFT_310871 [Diplogelasinospora grovesii]